MKHRRTLVSLFAIALLCAIAACGGSRPSPVVTGTEIVPVASASGSPLSVAIAQAAQQPVGDADAKIPIWPDDPIRGNRDAYVTLVVFSDFQCPFCARLVTTLEQARDTYGSSELRIVYKNNPLPFHPSAKLAATIGQAVFALEGEEAFWRYHDIVFHNQAQMSGERGPEVLRRWAVSAGVDPQRLEQGLSRGEWDAKIERDMKLAKELDANGTPASFLNGVSLSGAQPFDKFKQIIDAELQRAKAMEERGVARGAIYQQAVAENYHPHAKDDRDDDDDDAKPDTTVFKVPVGTSPVRGKSTALVTVVEFADFQCPYCKRVESTLEQLRRDYGDKIRFVWKDEPLPFHPRAKPAAELARFARARKGDAAFWDVHDKIFASQPKLDDADLEQVARDAGLDPAGAMAAINGKTYEKGIDADASLGDDVQAAGTPHFFVNGRRLVGAQPVDKFKPLIDEEMKKAEALVAAGTAPSAVYDETIKNGKGPPEPEKKAVTFTGSAPFRGPANAPVTIVEMSDFQCPFCARVEPTLVELQKAYPTKVKLVWRNLPLPMHVHAPLAAEAAREAFTQKGNDGFQKMRDLLFANQQALERSDLDGYATKIGLDMNKFARALDGHVHKAQVDAEAKAANDAGVSGTPAFLVGPYFVSGAQPIEKFKKLVERTLSPPAAAPATPAPAPAPKPLAVAAAPGATKLAIVDLALGSGAAAKKGDKLEVHYTGTLTDGTVFDSSRKHGQTFTFTLGGGQVIKGWDQGLVGMKVGGRRKLTIPPDLGYGDRGAGATIPPKSTLVFDVELISIK